MSLTALELTVALPIAGVIVETGRTTYTVTSVIRRYLKSL